MFRAGILIKAISTLAAGGTAVALTSGAGGLAGSGVGLTQAGDGCTVAANAQVCPRMFDGSQVLVPGGAPITREVALTFHGSSTSTAAGLYLTRFVSRSDASSPMCTATDPASMLELTVTQGANDLFRGTLSSFAAAHSDPPTLLALAGSGGKPDRWAPGDVVTVDLSMRMLASADNAYMGCVSTTDFTWYAS